MTRSGGVILNLFTVHNTRTKLHFCVIVRCVFLITLSEILQKIVFGFQGPGADGDKVKWKPFISAKIDFSHPFKVGRNLYHSSAVLSGIERAVKKNAFYQYICPDIYGCWTCFRWQNGSHPRLSLFFTVLWRFGESKTIWYRPCMFAVYHLLLTAYVRGKNTYQIDVNKKTCLLRSYPELVLLLPLAA